MHLPTLGGKPVAHPSIAALGGPAREPASAPDPTTAGGARFDFRAVFEEFLPRLRGFFLACRLQPADADDLSQSVLMSVYRAREAFRGEGSLDAWVYSIARNAARDEWRRRGRDAEFAPVEETIPDERPAAPSEVLGRGELSRTIAALGKLPAGQRTCLLLHVEAGLSYREVARRLSLSLPTVKAQIWNARRRLRRLVAPLPSGSGGRRDEGSAGRTTIGG